MVEEFCLAAFCEIRSNAPMFFIMSKLSAVLLDPLVPLFGLMAYAGFRARFARLGRLFFWGGFAVLYALSTPLLSGTLFGKLESAVNAEDNYAQHYDAVIVLSGMTDLKLSTDADIEFAEAVDRILKGMELLREGRAGYMIISGGSGQLWGQKKSEAELLGKFAVAWGVPVEKVIVEGVSRNTRENAIESGKIIEKREFAKIAIITSAFHMKRALGCFRAVGFEPDVIPVDFRADPISLDDFRNYLPSVGALGTSATLLHELVGVVVYRLSGYAAY